jgi:N,N'-diacetyllegionaminate synthase
VTKLSFFNSGFCIGSVDIHPACSPFVVAEVGINHNGELERALEMIHVAKDAGCDAVKFQTFKASEFVSDPEQMFTYRSQGNEVTESMLAMFKRYELPLSAWAVIKAECESAGIQFMSTPQNRGDLDILLGLGVPAVKVGSDDFTNLPLLKSYAASGLPMILSMGMSDLAEAHQALEAVGAFEGYPLILLICTSQYPTPSTDAHLSRITTLKQAFPGLLVGYSDHTQGPIASSLAVALGAVFLEKHFTLDQDLPGPDHWFSENPEGLRNWVASIRTSHKLMGSPLLRPTPVERVNKAEYQRRLVAARDIAQGAIFELNDINLKRMPGGRGLPPAFLDHLLGRPAPRHYVFGDPIEL